MMTNAESTIKNPPHGDGNRFMKKFTADQLLFALMAAGVIMGLTLYRYFFMLS
jgi:hypothetical protein